MQWASALSLEPELDAAVAQCVAQLKEDLEGGAPDLLAVFVSPDHLPQADALGARLMMALSADCLIGCSGGGVIGDGREAEQRSALSVTAAALPDVRLDALHLTQRDLPGETDIEPFAELFRADEDSCFLALPDPFTIDVEKLLRAMDRAYPGRPKVGGLASGGLLPDSHALFVNDAVHRGGAAILAMSGDIHMDAIVAQGCRPIGQPMFITKCEENALLEINGMSPNAILRQIYERLDTRDRALFGRALFLGIEMTMKEDAYGPGDFLIRNIIGADPDNGSLRIGARLQETAVAQFHLRDAATSREDLARQLDRYLETAVRPPPAGALMFSCLGRGAGLYGVPNHDANLFMDKLGPAPLGGFFCNGEIGPVQSQTFLHSYTSSFGLFRPVF